MSYRKFIKEKMIFLLFQGFLIGYIGLLLKFYQVNFTFIFIILLSLIFITFLSVHCEYLRKQNYYRDLLLTVNHLEKKQYLSMMIQEPPFEDGKLFYQILHDISKSMHHEINCYKHQCEEYKDYIEAWIHEVKLPIACIDLICENEKNETTSMIQNELLRIDYFVEQALYYTRSSVVEKDYIVKKLCLSQVVKDTLKKQSKQLISAKASIEMDLEDTVVYSDPKWLDFILTQIISNSIKYRKDPFQLKFSVIHHKECLELQIQDNGIGILEHELPYVFEKGFTGSNGRHTQKSTGIGLYLCKKLCNKLHLGISVTSCVLHYTCISITFPKDSRILLS